jgi:hypothetical protein
VLVFSFGSAEKGQLGNGTTGERITTGNKTSYDIESTPGVLFASFLTSFYDLTFHRHPSLYQGARWEEHRSNRVRATAQSGTGFDRVSPISLPSNNFNPNVCGSLAYVWGYNGYCRLGLGNQVDALKPKVVPQVMIRQSSKMGKCS